MLTAYDRAGGGLIASGLAYAALIALLPGMLLVLSIFALVISDEATRERIVSLIAEAIPPLEDVVRTAFEQVSTGAVPTGIIAFVGLLWGASRFYAALDYSFTRVFHTSRARNEIQRTFRGVLLVGAVVLLPLVALLAGTLVGWVASLMDEPPDLPGLLNGDLALVLHIGSYVMFVGGGPARVPVRAGGARPAAARSCGRASSSASCSACSPRCSRCSRPLLTHVAAIYGTFVAAFAILAWMSISFNVLLLGACWTRVRALADSVPAPAAPSE